MPQIKLTLAIFLFICLLNMPYGYYELVRLISAIGFSYLAYQLYQQKRQSEMIVYLTLALLFQPFFKIALGRQIWNIVDVIVGIWLLLSLFLRPHDHNKRDNDFKQDQTKTSNNTER